MALAIADVTEIEGTAYPTEMSEFTLLSGYLGNPTWNITHRDSEYIEFTRSSDNFVVRVFVPTS